MSRSDSVRERATCAVHQGLRTSKWGREDLQLRRGEGEAGSGWSLPCSQDSCLVSWAKFERILSIFRLLWLVKMKFLLVGLFFTQIQWLILSISQFTIFWHCEIFPGHWCLHFSIANPIFLIPLSQTNKLTGQISNNLPNLIGFNFFPFILLFEYPSLFFSLRLAFPFILWFQCTFTWTSEHYRCGTCTPTVCHIWRVLSPFLSQKEHSFPFLFPRWRIVPSYLYDLVPSLSHRAANPNIQGSFTLDDAEVTDLKAGKFYINLHTLSHPNGELRGQLTDASSSSSGQLSRRNILPQVTPSLVVQALRIQPWFCRSHSSLWQLHW